jgi:hypothetical protein
LRVDIPWLHGRRRVDVVHRAARFAWRGIQQCHRWRQHPMR